MYFNERETVRQNEVFICFLLCHESYGSEYGDNLDASVEIKQLNEIKLLKLGSRGGLQRC